MKTKIAKKLKKVPQFTSTQMAKVDPLEFPLAHYSYSSLVKFSTNPIMFKINYINGDRIDSTRNINGVIGNAFHAAMETYYSSDAEDPMKEALKDGMNYLGELNDGFIEFSTAVQGKQKAQEILSFVFAEYTKYKNSSADDELVKCEDDFLEKVDVQWNGHHVVLPVPIKGYIDKLVRRKEDGRLKVIDYKTTRAFTNPDKIDGKKIIQAITYYFGVLAKYGEAPYSMVYEEAKVTKNRDGSPQVKEYEIVYEENELFFHFFFRLYDDVTRAINGEAVFVPNIDTFFDNEISIIAYVHRLDVSEEKAELMKKEGVKNITELLQKKIQNAGNMRKFMKTVEKQFVSAKNLNYDKMKNSEKITTKLMEHGMIVQYEGKVEGNAVTLYKFNPTIGLKMSKLMGYMKDVEQVLGVSGIRVLAPIPNTSLVGFEVPRKERTFLGLPPAPKGFEIALGEDIYGETYYFDIREAPHMLVAGASGSGKSVFLNSVISQLATLPDVELHLFDPKRVELSQFKSQAKQYESDIEDIDKALKDLVDEMEYRYLHMEEQGIRKMEGQMPYKFIIMDEFGDLTISNHIKSKTVNTGEIYKSGVNKGLEKTKVVKTNISKRISKNVTLLAQKARAAGMHIIIATQRPSVEVITGVIKANFPCTAMFRVAKEIDSRVISDDLGGEKLLGKGDMLFSSDVEDVRLQGFNI